MTKPSSIKEYFLNCFLLTIPILAWNIVLADQLPAPFTPEVFGNNIPSLLVIGENIFRMGIFLLTFLMPLSIVSTAQKSGFVLYIIGTLLYFASWLALIWYPGSEWSSSRMGFLAPAYTPLFWLAGITLVGTRFYFNLPFAQRIFMVTSMLFLLFHNIHTLIIYNRIY